MHIPDGFINGATSAGFGVAAAGGLGVAVKQTGKYLSERQVPLAGLVAAFVFAAQMVNFPVISGMSGHILGAVLAAVLVGPWAAFVVISVVLIVQGVFFADGGLTALGLNIVNIGLIAGIGGYTIHRVLRRLAPKNQRWLVWSAGLAAGLSVPLAAMGFVTQYAIGGASDVSVGAVATAMLTTHALIGIGEGIITALVIGAVVRTRPDLVYAAPAYTGSPTAVVKT